MITKGLDVLPIQIRNNIIFIEETKSLIYQANSDFTYRYSTINDQGVIVSTYLLNGLNNIDIETKYYIDNNIIYLFYYQIISYQTIDLNLMASGQSGYLKTLYYPTAAHPCTTNAIQIYKIGACFYYLCFDSSNLFLLQSLIFQELFTTTKAYTSKSLGLGMRNEKSYIILDDQLFTNGTINNIKLSFANTFDIQLINMKWNLYLIDDYLTKVQISNSIFKDIASVKLYNTPKNLLVSDVIDFPTELQSTGVNLPFIDYLTFLQYQNMIFIGSYQYNIAYIPSNNQVEVTQNPYSVTFQAMQGYNQYLINIYQAYNFCVPHCQTCASMITCSICQSPYYLDSQFQCADKCPTQFVLDSTNKKCICRPNSSLINQSCPCNKTYFDSNGSCLNCPQNCVTCTSLTICQICQTGYFNLDGNCVQSCPNNFIIDQNNKKCICRPNSSLINQSCPCNKTYFDSNGSCLNCPQNCITCTSLTICQICQTGYFNLDGNCVQSCPNNFIIDQNNKKCICRLNSTLQNSSCPCNDGYVDINDICQPCPPNCKICNNQLFCSACVQNYYLTVQETCVLSCPPPFIPDITNTKCICRLNSNLQNAQCPCNDGYVDINNVCLQCPPNCKLCASQSVCTLCAQNYYLSAQQVCVSSCPATFIIDQSSTKCVCDVKKILQNGICSDQCNSNCQTCDKNNNKICSACYPGFALYEQTCQQVYLNYGSQNEQIYQLTYVISEVAQYSSILKNTISKIEVFKFILRRYS
ncbi:hypothetical protein TTHERM_000559855 (macronuclear) [Tetrahymena thermophila SB210]|uniref:EGF-like domain-containing protein n=1 Tax=Tetrahymena thermophila (strain SB210) TaxID=312017 RepID=W7XE19_TETTS|nr:hypothetical protein TTHERM_000559855 [Tetrahymena thermophila SB210]EWS75877.1 hypothetical protein TTHERM_000559855 [Tetrahymena thermophila SB210]|eukprot:XP_012651580.1 hypothetical protein TTHERM_000559855 [Tetrahymena thermophila SB210]